MATLHHNISGEITKELLSAGDNINVSKISLVNTHVDTNCFVDLYIEKKLTGTFYLLKKVELPVRATLICDGVKFNNSTDEFGLYVKLTKSASETPEVDVIIN